MTSELLTNFKGYNETVQQQLHNTTALPITFLQTSPRHWYWLP